jgi:hypothetical protein
MPPVRSRPTIRAGSDLEERVLRGDGDSPVCAHRPCDRLAWNNQGYLLPDL